MARSAFYSNLVDIRDWIGVGADNDDTAEIQEAFEQAEGASSTTGRSRGHVRLPGGVFNVGALTLNRPVGLHGAGLGATRLQGIAGTTNAFINIAVAHDGTNYYSAGALPPAVHISNLTVRGAGKADGGGANGILLRNAGTNPITARVVLENVDVTNVANDGLAADAVGGGWNGYLSMRGGALFNNARDGLYAVSCTDWILDDVEIGVNGRNGSLVSGCAEFRFDKVYTYSNSNLGLYNFNSDLIYSQGMIDRNLLGGYFHDIRNDQYVATIASTSFLLNSGAASNQTSDVIIGAATARDAYLFDCRFAIPQSGLSGASKHNIEFEHASNGADVFSRDNIFKAGTIASTNVTNQTGRVY